MFTSTCRRSTKISCPIRLAKNTCVSQNSQDSQNSQNTEQSIRFTQFIGKFHVVDGYGIAQQRNGRRGQSKTPASVDGEWSSLEQYNTDENEKKRTRKLKNSSRQQHHVADDGLIIVYQINTVDATASSNSASNAGGSSSNTTTTTTNNNNTTTCSRIPFVKSLKARYEGNSDAEFHSIKNFSDSIPLRACPTFAGLGRSFFFLEVPLDSTVDGNLEELMLSFDKRFVNKVEQIVVLSNDRRFIPLASSLPLDEEHRMYTLQQQQEQQQQQQQQQQEQQQLSRKQDLAATRVGTVSSNSGTSSTVGVLQTASTTPTTVSKSARGLRPYDSGSNALLSSLKSSAIILSATQQEKLFNKIKSYKRSISPNF